MQNVPKSVNMNVDTGEKTWLTPRYILDALGEFDTDPCVPDVMPWRTANTMYTKSQNGLVQPWHGRVWLNPPYGKDAIPFFDRMTTHAGGGGSRSCSRVPTRICGTITSSHAQAEYCFCVDESDSWMRMALKCRRPRRHPRLCLSAARMLTFSKTVALKANS